MKQLFLIFALLFNVNVVAHAQTIGPPSIGSPSGAAGGDLTGTYPNPSLATSITGAHTFSGALTASAAGASGVPGQNVTGAWFTGGGTTATKPQLLIEPAGTTSTAWPNAGAGIGVNAPSGFTGQLIALQLNGAARTSVDNNGNVVTSGGYQAGGASQLLWSGGGILTSTGVGVIKFGAADVDTNASIVAQTLRSQGTLAGGTSNQAGKDFTLLVSPGKGTGIGGSFILQTAPAGITGTVVNAGVTAFKTDSTGLITVPLIASDAALTDTTVCQDTTNHGLRSGSGALGICLGTSGRQFKTAFAPMTAGLDEVMKIKLWNYRYKPGHGDNGARMQYGPTAQDVEAVLPDLAGHDEKGETINYDWGAFIPIALRAIQQLKNDNDNLRQEMSELKRYK